jgi:type I restriction enzyme, S subunit
LNVQATAEIPISVRRWKSYPAYKKSGVEWVPKIPSHWEMQRLKFVLLQRLQYGANEEAGETDVASPRFVRITDINNRGELRDDTFRSLAEEKAKPYLLEEGDVLLARSGATVGKSFQYRNTWGRCCFAGYLIRARLDQTNCLPDFLNYFTSSINYWDWIASSLIQATIQNVSAEKYGNLSLPLPPTPEQQTIISFLDRETAKIDAVVAKKERLIELLQEKRAALITHAVTKGLPSIGSGQATPKVPMKDSGVEWLGKTPAHWDVAPVYSRYEVALGKMLDAKRVTGEHLAPYLRNVDVQWNRVNIENLPEMDFHAGERGRYGLRPGDLLVCEGGEVGRTALWRGELKECFYQKAIHRVRPLSEKDIPRYLYYVMYAAASRGVFVAGGNPNTIDHLTAIQLRHYRLLFPTKEEQVRITAVLDEETAKIDALIAKVRDGIEKLKEYRTALISAAVTGKIDVRDCGRDLMKVK